MQQYLDLVRRVLDKGKLKHNRTGVDCIAIAGAEFEFDMSKGYYPLLTTKEMAHKSMRVELEGFLKGITDKKWYQERGCHLWDEWSNPKRILDQLTRSAIGYGGGEMVTIDTERNIGVALSEMWSLYKRNSRDSNGNLKIHKKTKVAIEDLKASGYLINPDELFSEDDKIFERTWESIKEKKYLKKELDGTLAGKIQKLAQLLQFDLGPIYGFNWRHFGAEYSGMNTERNVNNEEFSRDYTGKGIDQVKNIVDTLKRNPNDRRMLVSAWDPEKLPEMALPPCHWGYQVTVIDNELNLLWNQRSVDMMLGLPFNIASYGLLLHLFARESGFKEGKLIGFLGDVHIYENQIEGAKEQLKREPRQLPTIDLPGFTSLYNWDHKQFELKGYNPHPKIEFPIAV